MIKINLCSQRIQYYWKDRPIDRWWIDDRWYRWNQCKYCARDMQRVTKEQAKEHLSQIEWSSKVFWSRWEPGLSYNWEIGVIHIKGEWGIFQVVEEAFYWSLEITKSNEDSIRLQLVQCECERRIAIDEAEEVGRSWILKKYMVWLW